MPTSELTISAESNDPKLILQISPFDLKLDSLLIGKSENTQIEIKNLDSTTVNLEVVSQPSTAYVKDFKIKSLTLKPNQAVPVDIVLRDNIPPGPFTTSLTLDVKGKEGTRVTIPIWGYVVEKM